ncbi:MAG TPA: trehalase family glycosidase [Thermotogota bacterium]|nr:trehalase family glycosidase [Thermotogota bacterium]HQQ66575.1 trehalase family glycosidase [Thermotogota bacterium]
MEKSILKFLKRTDKWYIGGGKKLIWTPPFPSFLHHPGLWDNAGYYDLRVDPGFTYDILENGVPYAWKQIKREWTPACWTCDYEADGLLMKEEKTINPNDFLGIRVSLTNRTEKTVHLQTVVWTSQKRNEDEKLEDTQFLRKTSDSVIVKKRLIKGVRKPVYAYAGLILKNGRSSNVSFSENTGNLPNWRLTPFYEKLTPEGLLGEATTDGISLNGLLYMGIENTLTLLPGETKSFLCGLTMGSSAEMVEKTMYDSLETDIVAVSEQNWNSYFESVPAFSCSDPWLEKYYWYRWYGLRLFTINVQDGKMHYPAVAEGLEYFRVFITYSAQCHMLETRWMHDDAIAKGSLKNFVENQRADGSFVGHIYLNGVQENGFYHADWGRVLQEVQAVYPDINYLKSVYEGLKKYVEYFDTVRDPEKCGLYDVVDQFETGQEFMSRYQAVDELADRYGWINNIRLKGVDATVYIYNLKKTLAWISEKIALPEESADWKVGAEKIRSAVLEKMWDEEDDMFYDVNPRDFTRTKIKAAVCFYPYMTDIVSEKHLAGLKKHLLNEKEFWTPYPVPSTAVGDVYFDPWAQWKGKRHSCPWNGRVWPMTNSHIADALGISARRFSDQELRDKTVEFIKKFVGMMFYEGDIERPNCFEHYNPYNGKASVYRGVDDYQHSWVVDLYFRYLIGLTVSDKTVEIDPFPFGCTYEVKDVLIDGKHWDFFWDGKQYTISVDGTVRYQDTRLHKMVFEK